MEQKALIDEGGNKVYEQHEKIIADLEAGDAEKAEKALKARLLSTGEKLITATLGPARP